MSDLFFFHIDVVVDACLKTNVAVDADSIVLNLRKGDHSMGTTLI